MKTYRLVVTGKVQGVNYRSSARSIGKQLRITGTVRNLESGEVEAVITGDPERLQSFIEWANAGPSMAAVSRVLVEEIAYQPFEDFTIIR